MLDGWCRLSRVESMDAAGASRDEGSSSLDAPPENQPDFPPTNSGVMRGWLTTFTPPAGQRLWFVLSLETLAYYDSPEAADLAEPLGMLGIDEMQWVKGARCKPVPSLLCHLVKNMELPPRDRLLLSPHGNQPPSPL